MLCPYIYIMRTTVNIDDDIFGAVKSLANERSVPIGQVISELVRKGLKSQNTYQIENDFPIFKVSEDSPPITPDQVKTDEDYY